LYLIPAKLSPFHRLLQILGAILLLFPQDKSEPFRLYCRKSLIKLTHRSGCTVGAFHLHNDLMRMAYNPTAALIFLLYPIVFQDI
jgi:hypothetical protein